MRPSQRFLTRTAVLVSACDPDDTTNGILLTDPIDCLPFSLQNGLLAFNPMSSGSLEDATDMEYHLSNPTSASPTSDRGGNPQCAFSFNAQNNECLKYDDPSFMDGLNAITISLWFQPDSASGGQLQAIVCRGDGGGHCPNLVDYYSYQWDHLPAIYENGNYQLWMDGMPTESVMFPGICPNPEVMEDIGALYIGRTYSGKIDDVAIYNRTLNPAEIQQLRTIWTTSKHHIQ
ncbi:MAG: LamG domain-containing protein [Flavobacteriales bacterium]